MLPDADYIATHNCCTADSGNCSAHTVGRCNCSLAGTPGIDNYEADRILSPMGQALLEAGSILHSRIFLSGSLYSGNLNNQAKRHLTMAIDFRMQRATCQMPQILRLRLVELPLNELVSTSARVNKESTTYTNKLTSSCTFVYIIDEQKTKEETHRGFERSRRRR